MKREITFLLAVVMLSTLLASCGETTKPPATTITIAPTATSSPAPSSPLPPTPTETSAQRLVGIPGSHIKDIQLGVEKFGATDHSASGAPEGAPYRWSADKSWIEPETGTSLDYSIIGDDDSQLVSGSFGSTWDGLLDASSYTALSEYYLGFVATMPYDTADADATRQWVLDNLAKIKEGEELTTTVGDATFTLSSTQNADGLATSFLLQINLSA